MNKSITAALLCVGVTLGFSAAGEQSTPADSSLGKTVSTTRPAPIARSDAPDSSSADPDAVRFAADARWEIAGYNNEEIVYTILVTNQDKRIIRCTTQIKGWYYENGQKLGIEDRQLTTILPDQQTQVGNWMGMDEKSGASYSVKCRPV